MRLHGWAIGLLGAAGLALFLPLSLAAPQARAAAETPLELKWADLIPATAAKPLRPFFAGRSPLAPDPTQPTLPETIPEGRWMSGPTQATRATQPPAVVESLNGKRVNIGGYVVPLAFDSTSVKEFLLVPFVGACIHVPPPPPNQIVYVKVAKGFEVKSLFEPVWVTGQLTTTVQFTGLADAGYTLEAERVAPRKE